MVYRKNTSGGIDWYDWDLREVDTGDWGYIIDEILESDEIINNIDSISEKINNAKELNKYWHFRLSASQRRIIYLSFCLIAGTVAELTEGIIYGDGWEYGIVPCESELFFEFYFNYENTKNESFEEGIKKDILSIKKELEIAKKEN